MEIDLTRFSPQSFEKMVRMLALEEFGTSTQFFSRGPDAGRDFTVDGEIRGYESRGWNGYLVGQAKFREAVESSQAPEQWLKKQLNAEQERFRRPSGGRKKPSYYIIATNIRLSGADSDKKKGGLTKVADVLDKWKSMLGLKDYDIWHGEKIEELLKKHDAVRRLFSAWVAPYDILTTVLEGMSAPQFTDTIRLTLKKNFVEELYVPLKESGDEGDRRITAGQVFVDLPVREDQNSLREKAELITAKIVARSNDNLKHDGLLAEGQSKGPPDRIVLLGGPGQGKSTVSRFLAQLFRANLIRSLGTFNSDPALSQHVPEILSKARQENIPLPAARYPVFVSLPRFADYTSRKKELDGEMASTSLLSYIAQSLSSSADQTIAPALLRKWLKLAPWLVILDGLDEVPPSGARKSVLEAINGFVTEIGDAQADVLLIVTSRPQGFNEDLPSPTWEQWHLAHLSSERALEYAKRLGEIRLPHQGNERAEILSRLRDAANAPATGPLMISPLQVTILYVIAEASGPIPTDRWTLFKRYYEVLKNRERTKVGEVGRAIQKHSSLIDLIHRWAGFVLQVLSEGPGNATSYLTKDDFDRMVKAGLQREGFDADLDERTAQLAELALTRLILLSAQTEGQIRFDVRSLQEFMAADVLSSGDYRDVESRLKKVSTGAHWRNVVLIAASRIFSDPSCDHLRSMITDLVVTLDHASPADISNKTGAQLARDLFADGVARNNPARRKAMLEQALKLLDCGPDTDDDALIGLWDGESDVKEQLLKYIVAAIDCPPDHPRFGAAWKLLFLASSAGLADASDLILSRWPHASDAAFEVAKSVTFPVLRVAIAEKVKTAILTRPPFDCPHNLYRHMYGDQNDLADEDRASKILKTLVSFHYPRGDVEAKFLPGIELSFSSVGRNGHYAEYNKDEFRRSEWHWLHYASFFTERPSTESFRDCVVALSTIDSGQTFFKTLPFLPWPISNFLKRYSTWEEFRRKFDSDLRSVRMETDWLVKEQKWLSDGIKLESFLVGASEAPPVCIRSSIHRSPEATRSGLSLAQFCTGPDLNPIYKLVLSQSASFAIGTFNGVDKELLTRSVIVSILECVEYVRLKSDYLPTDCIYGLAPYVPEDLAKRVDCLIETPLFGRFERLDEAALEKLVEIINANPERRKCLIVLANSLQRTRSSKRSFISTLNEKTLVVRPDEPVDLQASIVALRIYAGLPIDKNDAKRLVELIFEKDRFFNFRPLVEAAKLAPGTIPIDDLICLLIEEIEARRPGAAESFRILLRGRLDARESGLTIRQAWLEANLPYEAYDSVVSHHMN